MINAGLLDKDFYALRKEDQSGFKTHRVETLPAGFQLFKLTQHDWADVTKGGYMGNLSPWWSAMRPFKEDDEGALGRFEQARLNKIDMSAMVRYMSAVCIDWNDLDSYLQIKLNTPCKCFFGKFAPMKKVSKPSYSLKDIKALKEREKNSVAKFGAEMPDDIGALDAWQFFIPNLKPENVTREALLNAHDMSVLAQHFGLLAA